MGRQQAALLLAMVAAFAESPQKDEMQPCQCEHTAHFLKEARTPGGNLGHNYGFRFDSCVKVETQYGAFSVCENCRKDCLSAEV